MYDIRPRKHFCKFILYTYMLVVFANCLPEDDFYDTNSTTSIKTNRLDSIKLNSSPTCPSNRCLRKCCQVTEIYYTWNGTCVLDNGNKLKNANWSAPFSEFQAIYDLPCQTVEELEKSVPYVLLSNGSIQISKELVNFEQYCVDYTTEAGKIRPIFCTEKTISNNTNIIEDDKFRFVLYSIGFGISNLFLIVTLGLYSATPELRKKIYNQCFMCHLMTLFIGFSSLISIQNIGLENPACAFLGYMSQFWLLAGIFWLNIMCIDMLRTLGKGQTLEESNFRKLLVYSLYAYGCPSLILIFSLLADHLLPSRHPLRTGFAEETCWFRQNEGGGSWRDPIYIHFYSFITVTLLVNFYTFVRTALLIKSEDERWKENKNGESRRHKSQKSRIITYLKLFIVTGLYWAMEIISYHSDSKNTVWITIDLINTLQGVFIFIIFICNKSVLLILEERFFPRRVFLRKQKQIMAAQKCGALHKMHHMGEIYVVQQEKFKKVENEDV